MKRIVLIRHGKTAANEQRLYCGAADLPLSAQGTAELEAMKTAHVYPNPQGYRIITSGMLRCEQTLAVLFGDVPHMVLPQLREMNFGRFELQSYEQLKAVPEYVAWISGDNESNTPPDGESGKAMQKRVVSAFDPLLADGNDYIVITHGGVIAAIMATVFCSVSKTRYEWQPQNGLGYLITISLESDAEYAELKA